MQLLLTGGTGFFGRSLLRLLLTNTELLLAGGTVTVLTRSPALFLKQYPEFDGLPWLLFHEGHICRPATLPGGAYTHILHAAADSTLGPQLTPLQRYDQIVGGTRNMLEFAVRCGARRFLLTSSGGVYGRQPQHLEQIPEDWHGMPDVLDPGNAYSVAKRAAEHLCALYGDAYGLHTVVARCFAFVGRDLPLDVHFAIGNFIRDALWRDEIVVSGDGSPLRSYLAQDDLAHWLLTMLVHGAAGRAYNVGSDEATSIADLACRVRDTLAPGKPVRVMAKPGSDNVRNRYVPEIRRAKDELGLAVSIPLETAIRSTAEAARKRAESHVKQR